MNKVNHSYLVWGILPTWWPRGLCKGIISFFPPCSFSCGFWRIPNINVMRVDGRWKPFHWLLAPFGNSWGHMRSRSSLGKLLFSSLLLVPILEVYVVNKRWGCDDWSSKLWKEAACKGCWGDLWLSYPASWLSNRI